MNNSDSLGHQKAEIIKKFGEWTNHNIQLAGETYTIDKDAVTGAEVKLRRVAQIIADLSGQSFE
ncbi:MAG: SAM-dependent methyltransferase, partial [Oscillatoria sp. Prado101]|nr:SAM-dependent methyltransferase [Oscillatoria sp. Prado101]